MHYSLVLLPIEVGSIVVLGLTFGLAFMGSPRIPAQSKQRRALGLVKTELLKNDQNLVTHHATSHFPSTPCDHQFQVNRGILAEIPGCVDSIVAAHQALNNITTSSPKATFCAAQTQIAAAIKEINTTVAATNWDSLRPRRHPQHQFS